MNKRATENSILKFLIVSSVSSDNIVNGIIDDIINTAVKTAEVDEQKTKYLQHFVNKQDTIMSN
jgi:oligoribonuclease (3'-5' exoribonuclease)